MVSRVIPVDEFDLVIFGATGDLARRKILPGLYRRFLSEQMPRKARIIGAARSDLDDAGFRALVQSAIEEFVSDRKRDAAVIESFLQRLSFVSVDARGTDGWAELAGKVRKDVVQAFYFSVGPGLFGDIATRLHEYEIAGSDSRIVVEKPFGRDLE
ncbi:MAG: glucose-6-phosphate dehydrogenase, partial [Litoreibacter sp.]|nr:glucose-6-phosphate dehydrogenase [Litoreibacter sp.]